MIVPGAGAVLTDGPETDLAASSSQKFVFFVVAPVAGGDRLDPENDAWPLAYKLQDDLPGTEILNASAVDGPFGPQIMVRYRRPHPLGGTVLGMMMMRTEAGRALTGVVQVPEADRAFLDRAQTMFDAARIR
jgi:hypothetical protein